MDTHTPYAVQTITRWGDRFVVGRFKSEADAKCAFDAERPLKGMRVKLLHFFIENDDIQVKTLDEKKRRE